MGAAITSKEYRTGEAIEALCWLGSCFFFRLKVTTTQGASGKGLLFAILQPSSSMSLNIILVFYCSSSAPWTKHIKIMLLFSSKGKTNWIRKCFCCADPLPQVLRLCPGHLAASQPGIYITGTTSSISDFRTNNNGAAKLLVVGWLQ